MDLNVALRNLIDKKKSEGMTLTAMAEISGVNFTTLQSFAADKRKGVTLKTAEKLARALGFQLRLVKQKRKA